MSSPPWRVGSGLVTPDHISELRAVLGLPDPVAWDDVGGKPSTFPHAPHTHQIDHIAGLAEALAVRPVNRVEAYSGVTAANGDYVITFSAPFTVLPTVIPEPPAGANHFWLKISVSQTGAVYRLVQRSAVTVLAVEVLLAAVLPVSGASARVLVVGD